MQVLKTPSWRNAWYVDGREVSDIVIYNHTGELLRVGYGALLHGAGANALDGFPGVTSITNRNKAVYTRLEHFFCKGVLYVNAALFAGYSTVGLETRTFDGLQTAERATIDLCDHDKLWFTVTADRYTNYRNTPLGDRADAVAAIYNQHVADHPNRHISQRGALRLIEVLPGLVASACE